MEDIGYSSYICVFNLSTIYFVMMIYIAQCCFFIPLAIFAKVTDGKWGSREYLKHLQEKLFFDEMISIAVEGFLELCISGYLEHINPWRNPT
jgi:hypothetical protein